MRVPHVVDGIQVGQVEVLPDPEQAAWDHAVEWDELRRHLELPPALVERRRTNAVLLAAGAGLGAVGSVIAGTVL